MGELSIGAVAVGVLLDVLGSFAVWLLASIAADFDFGALAPVVILSLGLAQTTYGAFVAGCISKINYAAHGVAVAVFGLVIAFLLGWKPVEEVPAWFNAVACLGVLPAGGLGGYFAAALRRMDAR